DVRRRQESYPCTRTQNPAEGDKHMRLLFRLVFAVTLLTVTASVSAQDSPARVTIIYDAIGKSAELKHGWGYSALIEYGGRRVLFDTGGRLNDFAANVTSLGVDLSQLDFVVL